MALKKKKRDNTPPSFDMTPMIDCVFQLLIFFIVCTRFKQEERNMRADLPTDEGLSTAPAVPKEQITIYCDWNESDSTNQYVVAIGARGRKVVENSRMGLLDLVVFDKDGVSGVADKKARYRTVHNTLVAKVEQYIKDSGAKIEKLEISFAKDARSGATSGTAPWMFVSLAIDASVEINAKRKAAGQPELSVTFKFSDARGAYAGAKPGGGGAK
jgi:biopolymer transport protein ExbD